jgi:uncharacterized protein
MNLPVRAIPATASLEARIELLDWPQLAAKIDAQGWATIHGLLSPAECRTLAATYDDDRLFRSRVVMARHGFGRGEYKYFGYPLPDLVTRLRAAIYPRLVPLANCWNERMTSAARYPAVHADFIKRCHDAGQMRPTPLLLQYGPDDYNCLHQDVYGEQCFPLQAAILLSEPQTDFTGGEFALTEQRPRMQSRISVVPLRRGDAVVFAVQYRPVKGGRGNYRVNMRHGVSPLRSGRRHTLGIIFHDSV